MQYIDYINLGEINAYFKIIKDVDVILTYLR